MDAGNLLKPQLARGELRCIGATTLDEYRKYIEKDAALERRFQPVLVDEPSVEDTIAILRGLKERYEVHHGVRIQDAALVAAATLSHRYITDRFLPDKAIDLVDEAARRHEDRARLHAHGDRRASSARSCSSRWSGRRLKKEKDAASKERLERIESELAELGERAPALKAQWQKEKKVIDEQRKLQEQLEQLKHRTRAGPAHAATSAEASEIQYGHIPDLRSAKLEAHNAKLAEMQRSGAPMLKEEVTEEDIAKVVSAWTGIPVSNLREGEREKLVRMEDRLGERVIGQTHARSPPCRNAVRRARAGLQDENRPIGSLHLPRPHRRRQNRARPRARRVPLRRRARHDPHRHERIHGEAQRRAAHRRAARLRRLRGRRPAHRSRAPQAVHASSSSTRSKRRTTMSSTSCCKSSTTAASPTARAAPSISRTRSSS